MLRVLNQPQRAIPVMVAVLSRPEQKAVWPAAIKELQKLNQPGAGEPLLELALATQDENSRAAALTALANLIDPPPQTSVAMLPLIQHDGPALAAALAAMRHAVEVHRQQDLVTLRGVSEAISADQLQMLGTLAARLQAIAGPATATERSEAANNALKLGIATRLIPETPVEKITVSRVSGAEENGGRARRLVGGAEPEQGDAAEEQAGRDHPPTSESHRSASSTTGSFTCASGAPARTRASRQAPK